MPGWTDKWGDRGKELLPQRPCGRDWKQQIPQVAKLGAAPPLPPSPARLFPNALLNSWGLLETPLPSFSRKEKSEMGQILITQDSPRAVSGGPAVFIARGVKSVTM